MSLLQKIETPRKHKRRKKQSLSLPLFCRPPPWVHQLKPTTLLWPSSSRSEHTESVAFNCTLEEDLKPGRANNTLCMERSKNTHTTACDSWGRVWVCEYRTNKTAGNSFEASNKLRRGLSFCIIQLKGGRMERGEGTEQWKDQRSAWVGGCVGGAAVFKRGVKFLVWESAESRFRKKMLTNSNERKSLMWLE